MSVDKAVFDGPERLWADRGRAGWLLIAELMEFANEDATPLPASVGADFVECFGSILLRKEGAFAALREARPDPFARPREEPRPVLAATCVDARPRPRPRARACPRAREFPSFWPAPVALIGFPAACIYAVALRRTVAGRWVSSGRGVRWPQTQMTGRFFVGRSEAEATMSRVKKRNDDRSGRDRALL